ncbi:MAG: stage III sporulation protein AE [Oscillospiraceae bacterium]|nr:stage III sporulation protein AE [Oscillospiraceae bacterium]
METLNISSFIREGERFTRDVFPDLDGSELLTSAITGRLDNRGIINRVLNLFGRELVNALTLLGSILVIIIVHSILKSITENVGNESISEIAYYIQYILLVALIMSSFTGIIMSIRESILNLVGMMSTLVPILLALTIATGNIASATFLEPLIIFSIVIIGNIITSVILPITLVANVLGIISNISDRVQIGKLSKFFKSGITWFLGFVIVAFVSILSIQGTLTSNVDGITARSVKSAVSTFVPVVGKALGDSAGIVLRSWIGIKKWSRSCRYDFHNRNSISDQ